MRHLDDIHPGQCYEYYGEPAKVVDFDLSDEERYRILLACGKGFEDLEVAESCMHHPELFPEIGIPWQEYRYQQNQSKQYQRQARRMQRQLQQALKDRLAESKVKYNHWGARGEIVIRGELSQLTLILDQLREGMDEHAR